MPSADDMASGMAPTREDKKDGMRLRRGQPRKRSQPTGPPRRSGSHLRRWGGVRTTGSRHGATENEAKARGRRELGKLAHDQRHRYYDDSDPDSEHRRLDQLAPVPLPIPLPALAPQSATTPLPKPVPAVPQALSPASLSSGSSSLPLTAALAPPPAAPAPSPVAMQTPTPALPATALNPQIDNPVPAETLPEGKPGVIPVAPPAKANPTPLPPKAIAALPPVKASIASKQPTETPAPAQATPLAANSTPTPAVPVDTGRGENHPGLSATAEHALISVGSIGGFIIICFVCWIAWRALKKSQSQQLGPYGNQAPPQPPPHQLLARIPYFGRGQRGWQEMGNGPEDMRVGPSYYDQKRPSGNSEAFTMYDPRSQAQTMPKQGLADLPQLQTNLSPSNSYLPYMAASASIQNLRAESSPHGSHMTSQSQPAKQPFANLTQQPLGGFSPASNLDPFHANYGNGSGTSASGSVMQFANPQVAGTLQSAAASSRDRLATSNNPFIHESELPRQSSDPYGSNTRQVYRASELSSISSGFGDEDIIVPPTASRQFSENGAPGLDDQQASHVNQNTGASSDGYVNRDTIYTQASEDMPARFRTVNSWVNQQTGRVQRAVQRAEETVPPMPAMPPADERYTMMMDNEEPRRPDSIPALIPGVSAPAAKDAERAGS